ncbi:DUF3846 domain-containing protein [Streptomyces sp. NPDC001493]
MTQQESFALVMYPNGVIRVVEWPIESFTSLQVLYREIECDRIDAVAIGADLTMWVDDEGQINGSFVNLFATRIYAAHKKPHQLYQGTAVFTGGADRSGDTLGLTRDQIMRLIRMHMGEEAVQIPAPRPGQHLSIPAQRTK